jgi:DNA-binding NtrC family response regulator
MTRRDGEASLQADDGADVRPALTILLHPDLGRVGQRALLVRDDGGRVTTLSRLEPPFAGAGGVERPLADPYVSRNAVLLEHTPGGGIGVRPQPEASDIAADGLALSAPKRFDRRDLERGVVLEVGTRVVVLLHVADPAPPRSPELGLIGVSRAVERLRGEVMRVGPFNVPVLLCAEAGSGKELVARAIHAASPRAGRPFVSVSLAAVPQAMAAAALFGHARGAFAGAVGESTGYFGAADGGTLFLDDVGEIAPSLEEALVRAVERGEVQREGDAAPRRVDVRVVSATSDDPEALTGSGRSRAPLYERLRGHAVAVPPLRARREDVGVLLVHFLREELAALGRLDKLAPPERSARPWLPAWLVAAATRYEWPGNVRELRTLARQLVVAHLDAPEVPRGATVARLLAAVAATDSSRSGEGRASSPTSAEMLDTLQDFDPHAAVAEHEARTRGDRGPRRKLTDIAEDEVRRALEEHGWKPGPAAAALGVARSSLYELIRQSPNLRKGGDLAPDQIREALAAASGDVTRAAEALNVSERALRLRMRYLGMT